MQNPSIPATPSAVADIHLDPNAALAVAEHALATPIPVKSTFNLGKIKSTVTARHDGALMFRRVLGGGPMNKISDGYVTIAPNGQGGSRVAVHETRRFLIVMAISWAVIVALNVAIYFLFFRQSTPAYYNPYGYPGMGGGGSGTPWGMIGGIIGATIVAGALAYESTTIPKRTIDLIRHYAQGGAPAAQPGFPPMGQPGFPGQAPQTPYGAPPQPGFAPQGGQPQFGAAPPQPGFPPQQGFPPQPGFPPQQGFDPQQDQPPFPGQSPQPGFTPQGGAPPFNAPPPQAGMPPAADAGAAAGAAEVEQKLNELAQLRDNGIITPADYEQAKAAITRNRA